MLAVLALHHQFRYILHPTTRFIISETRMNHTASAILSIVGTFSLSQRYIKGTPYNQWHKFHKYDTDLSFCSKSPTSLAISQLRVLPHHSPVMCSLRIVSRQGSTNYSLWDSWTYGLFSQRVTGRELLL